MRLTASTTPQSAKKIERTWHLVDVKGKILGRAATDIAKILQGKHKTTYSTHLDSGDYVVIVNAKLIKVTGNKEQAKVYTRYSGFPGGLGKETLGQRMARKPEAVITSAVYGMLPKNKLRDRRLKRLFVYPTDKHPYEHKVTNK